MRNLPSGYRAAGTTPFRWDGRDDRGRPVRDGHYELWMTGSSSRMPTNTVTVPVRVDTRRPSIRPAHDRLFTRVIGTGLRVRLAVSVDEPGYLVVRTIRGRRRGGTRVPVERGVTRLTLTNWQLGMARSVGPGAYRVTLTVTDQGGNATTRHILVTVRSQQARPSPGVTPTPTTPAPPTGPSTPPTSPTSPTPPTAPAPTGRLQWPVDGQLTSPFGPRDGRLHTGIDIGMPSGSQIVAADEGVVTFAGTMNGYGNLVIVEHPNGLVTYYAHQSRIVAVTGTIVARGQVIGYVGSTGHSTGPHLHFEVRVGGVPKDPLSYLAVR